MTTAPVLLTTVSGLVERPVRPWHRGLIKLRGRGLDRRIAAGESPDGDRLVAARARELLDRRYRVELASLWQDTVLACDAIRPTSLHSVPVSRQQMRAAEREIGQLVETLHAKRPVSARGVAMASLLMTDAAGPVFRRTTPTLAAVLRGVIAACDPLAELSVRAA
jgi:hypothetical protein